MARRKKESVAAPLKWEDVPEIPKEEQPYPLPEGWKWVRLGDVVDISNETQDVFNGEKYIGLEHIEKGGGTTGYGNSGGLKSLKNVFRKNAILYGKLRPYLNKHCIADFKGVCSTDICVFYAKQYALNKFVDLYFNTEFFIENAVNNSRGINLPRVSPKELLRTPFPCPRIEVQKSIVLRIESLFSRLAGAAEKIQTVIDSHEARMQAILHRAFSGELTGTEPRGFFPISHFVQKEKNSIKAGPFGSALKKDSYVPEGYKVYGQEQVISGDEKFGDYFISEEKYQELKSCAIKPGDILISLVGTVGRVLVLSENCRPGVINPRLIKITLNPRKMLPQFFSYYFQSDNFKFSYRKDTHGTTMDVLNMKILKQLTFPNFTLKEQRKIVRVLDAIFIRKEHIKERSEYVLRQLEKSKKTILAKAFSGKLI